MTGPKGDFRPLRPPEMPSPHSVWAACLERTLGRCRAQSSNERPMLSRPCQLMSQAFEPPAGQGTAERQCGRKMGFLANNRAPWMRKEHRADETDQSSRSAPSEVLENGWGRGPTEHGLMWRGPCRSSRWWHITSQLVLAPSAESLFRAPPRPRRHQQDACNPRSLQGIAHAREQRQTFGH
jgi:hypothetical protein